MQNRNKHPAFEKKTIIACDVFRSALQYLGVDEINTPIKIIYLPSYLHLHPDDLRKQFLQHLERWRNTITIAGCLYGQCFPDIDTVLGAEGFLRIPCGHCYEILMGREAYSELISKHPGSFFLEKEVIEGFEKLCRIPLELDDPQMRTWYFEHYQQIVYIRQPTDRDFLGEVRSIAKFLSLELTIVNADYRDLISFLRQKHFL